MKGEMWMRARRLVAATAIAAAAFVATTQSALALNFGPGSPSAVFDGDVVFVLADLRTSPGTGPLPTTEVVGVLGNIGTNLIPGFSQNYTLPSALGTSIVGKTLVAIGVPQFDQTVPIDLGGGVFFDFARANIMFTANTANPGSLINTSAILNGMTNVNSWETNQVRPNIGAAPATDSVASISAGNVNSYSINLNLNETNTLSGVFPFGVGIALGSTSQSVAFWRADQDMKASFPDDPNAPLQEVAKLFDFRIADGPSAGTFTISIVPEPGTALLLGVGLLGLAWTGRKQRLA